MIGLIMVGVLATFLPRLLPYFLSGLKVPPRLERFLSLVPNAALGALILPGLLIDFPARPWAGALGTLAALAWAYFRGGLIVPVLLAFAVTWLCLLPS